MTNHPYDANRRSWNAATRNHNAHKGDQAATLRAGTELLFPEELALLGDLAGKRVAHLQCNAGQDTLCLARRGAVVTGIDLSDEAIAFARRLSSETGLAATFVESEVVRYLETTDDRFDLAFSSYGTIGWLPDLEAWARGVKRILAPGGRLVLVEFHPLVWSFDADLHLTGDDYFSPDPFVAPVGDYVKDAGAALGAVVSDRPVETVPNDVAATSYQYGLGQIVTAIIAAGLSLETLVEYPHSNGCKVTAGLVPGEQRRYVWPPGAARLPLMFGLVARPEAKAP